MKNQINGNSISTTIDLSNISTYGELKALLPSTGTGRVPGVNQLRKKAVCLLSKKTASGWVQIFDSGFYIFRECERETVYGVDRCEWPSTYTDDGKGSKKPLDFSPYPWDLILESAGSARLVHNSDSREVYQGEISIDAPESENNIALSVRPEHEIREEEEDMAERKSVMLSAMKEGIKKLKPRQQEILVLRYGEELTFDEIGKRMGITNRGSVFTNCERALKKVQKKIFVDELKM